MIMNTITETKNIVTSMPMKRCSINLAIIANPNNWKNEQMHKTPTH